MLPQYTPAQEKSAQGVRRMIAQYKNEFQVSLNRFFEQQLADARTQLIQQGLSPAEIERKLESMRFVVGSELGMLGSYVGPGQDPWQGNQPTNLWVRTDTQLNLPVVTPINIFQPTSPRGGTSPVSI